MSQGLQDSPITFQQFQGKWHNGTFSQIPALIGVDDSGSHFLAQEYQFDNRGRIKTKKGQPVIVNRSYALQDLPTTSTVVVDQPISVNHITGSQSFIPTSDIMLKIATVNAVTVSGSRRIEIFSNDINGSQIALFPSSKAVTGSTSIVTIGDLLDREIPIKSGSIFVVNNTDPGDTTYLVYMGLN